MKRVMIIFGIAAIEAVIFAIDTRLVWNLGAAVFCFGMGIAAAIRNKETPNDPA